MAFADPARQKEYNRDYSARRRARPDFVRWRPNRAQRRDAHWRGLYDVTLDDVQMMYVHQRGLCGICERPFQTHPSSLDVRLDFVVDHDHETKVVRGLLCRPCNHALGLFGDDVGGLQRAISYLAAK